MGCPHIGSNIAERRKNSQLGSRQVLMSGYGFGGRVSMAYYPHCAQECPGVRLAGRKVTEVRVTGRLSTTELLQSRFGHYSPSVPLRQYVLCATWAR
jgi:hypothetical protein